MKHEVGAVESWNSMNVIFKSPSSTHWPVFLSSLDTTSPTSKESNKLMFSGHFETRVRIKQLLFQPQTILKKKGMILKFSFFEIKTVKCSEGDVLENNYK